MEKEQGIQKPEDVGNILWKSEVLEEEEKLLEERGEQQVQTHEDEHDDEQDEAYS